MLRRTGLTGVVLCAALAGGADDTQAGAWRLHLGGWSSHSSPPRSPKWKPVVNEAARNWAEHSVTAFAPTEENIAFAPVPEEWNESHEGIGLSYETAGRWWLGALRFTDSFGYAATGIAAGKRWRMAGQEHGWSLGASLAIAAQHRQMSWVAALQPGTGVWVQNGQGEPTWVKAQAVLNRQIEWVYAPLPSISIGYKSVEVEVCGFPPSVTGDGTVVMATLVFRLF